jgi:hypothetical protein
MKTTTKLFLAGALLAVSSAPLVAAAAVNVDVNIGVPGIGYAAPQAVYYPAPVYYSHASRPFVHHRDWDRHDYRHDYRHDDHRRW